MTAEHREHNKRFAEKWIESVVSADAAAGLSDHNFGVPPARQMGQEAITDMRARGINIYTGSGNFFLVDLNGSWPRIIQRRPLAQRYVEILG